MQLCVDTSTVTVIATSIRSAWSHHRRGAAEVGLLRARAPWLAVRAVFGVITATSLKSDTLLLVSGTLAAVTGLCMLYGSPNWRLAGEHPGPVVHVPYSGAPQKIATTDGGMIGPMTDGAAVTAPAYCRADAPQRSV